MPGLCEFVRAARARLIRFGRIFFGARLLFPDCKTVNSQSRRRSLKTKNTESGASRAMLLRCGSAKYTVLCVCCCGCHCHGRCKNYVENTGFVSCATECDRLMVTAKPSKTKTFRSLVLKCNWRFLQILREQHIIRYSIQQI